MKAGWTAADIPVLDGRTAVVTGATGGIAHTAGCPRMCPFVPTYSELSAAGSVAW